MTRPKKQRCIQIDPEVTYFKPRAVPLVDLEQVNLGLDELRLETLYFGFRTRRGLHLKNFTQHYRQDLLADPPGLAYRLIQENKLTLHRKRLCPTSQGLALADSLALLW